MGTGGVSKRLEVEITKEFVQIIGGYRYVHYFDFGTNIISVYHVKIYQFYTLNISKLLYIKYTSKKLLKIFWMLRVVLDSCNLYIHIS